MVGDALDHPIWHALNTEHAGLAVGASHARRYRADVVPFAAFEPDRLKQNPAGSLRELAEILNPEERTWVSGEMPQPDSLTITGEIEALQMLCTAPPMNLDANDDAIVHLSAEDAPAMAGLTDVAFPGFFRRKTYLMGSYYGIQVQGLLVAMAGERLALPGYREISAVCTHPEHTGQGYAGRLMARLLKDHAAASVTSFLHVSAASDRAIALYERLRFVPRRTVHLRQITSARMQPEPPILVP
jgi:ribosomal protein S18 acetylase RimI-like enzyme